MTKAETGNPNQTQMTKPEAVRGAWSFELGHSLVIGAWSLVIRTSDLIRHSGFAIRTSPIRVHPCSSVVPSLFSGCEEMLGRLLSIRVHLRASAVKSLSPAEASAATLG
jgi:hypothetical protein